ncbi:fimbrial protein [uncultured Parabacteroides sp.]|uniref:fimbrial protein n=1 Tax=uncultured Parabacteroides sp. TaxID=512312 RepID=UPI00258EB6EF|nr:fimbrial protein [uncultured Parabacteroides sp.]
MKQYSLYIISILASFILLSACSDEEMGGKKNNVISGIPTTVRFSLNLPDAEEITTKASTGDDRIDNLYLFVFNGETLEFGEEVKITANNNVEFQIESGEKYIYAIANTTNGAFENLTEWIETKPSKTDFLAKTVSLSTDNVTNLTGAGLMIGGFCENASVEDATLNIVPCTIAPGKEKGVSITHGAIYLQRMRSEIVFKITDSPNFTLTSYEIQNVPRTSSLIAQSNPVSVGSSFSVKEDIKDNAESFSFYMLENMLSPQKTPMDSKQREDKTYYNPNSTYVVLKGTYKGNTALPDGGYAEADATVSYFIHLGKGAGSGYGVDYSDYSTYRNKKYTYSIKVTGVKSIIAEVKVDEDNDQRAEGDVILKTEGQVLYCDAHYETRVISFKKSEIDPNGLFYNAKTPKGDKDLDWIKFVKNDAGQSYAVDYTIAKSSNQLENVTALIQDLKDWKDVNNEGGTNEDGEEVRYYTCFINEYYYDDLSLDQFVNAEDRILLIGANAQYQNSSLGNSSVFEGKYVFKQRSIKSIYKLDDKATNPWGIETWNETGKLIFGKNSSGNDITGTSGTNANNGYENQVKFVNNNLNNEWSKAVKYSFITEDINKNEVPEYNLQPNKDTDISALTGAMYACMQRNRDENGDGVIDGDEIKWYLPASNQYISLWMGADALQDATLYAESTRKRSSDNHYFTSTSGKNLYWAEEGITAGGTGGDLKGTGENTDKRQYRCVRNLRSSSEVSSIYTKDIQNGITVVKPANLVDQSLRKERFNTEIGFDYLLDTDMSNRPYEKGFEYFSDVNNSKVTQYYDKDGRRMELSNVNWTTFYKNANENPANSYCAQYMKKKGYGEGWRMPNQRELALMYMSSGNTNGGNAVSRTLHSLTPPDWSNDQINNGKIDDGSKYSERTHTYVWHGAHSLFEVKKNSAILRCVRDIQ